MIRYLIHNDIDKIKWDACMDAALNQLVYGYSWYLDVAAPGWDALVLDDYEAIFPLPHRKKYFIHYVFQPMFTQQLGLFYKTTEGAASLDEFIQSIPEKFRYIDLHLNEFNHSNDEQLFRFITQRKNYILDLDKPITKLNKNFSDQARRNLKKAVKAELQSNEVDFNEVIQLYKKVKGNETLHVSSTDYITLENICSDLKRNQLLLSSGVQNPKGGLFAGAIFCVHGNRIIYMLGTSSPKGRELNAMNLIFSNIIEHHAGQARILDFEGSEIPGVARFFKSFGAKKQPYGHLHINKLPTVFRWLKK